MADLVVVTFRGQEDARKALDDLRVMEKSGGVLVDDVEVIERDADGEIHHIGRVDKATKGGALGGGFLGLLLGLVFFPVLGLAIGAIAGGLIGKSLGHNVDKQLVKDVTADLAPGTSALFLLMSGPGSALTGLFKPYEGTVDLTTVDPDLEALWGMIFGLLFLIPVAGLVIGGVMGALMGKMGDTGIKQEFISQVRDVLKPGMAGLVIMYRKATPDKTLEALAPFGGHVLKSSLSSDAKAAINEALNPDETPAHA